MKEVLILSGKGGTGKTSLAAAFAHLATGHVICDLDVDAPDMHLILKPENTRTEDFFSGHEALINNKKCTACGKCVEICKYGAIDQTGFIFRANPIKCEGCKVCVTFCPAEAIEFRERHCGRWFISDTRFGPLIHAQLFPGQENSGRLVALLRQKAKEMAKQKGLSLILSDGTPGIGCPVISSLSGVNLAVIVTESTPSGRHDLERVAELCGHFSVPVGIIINKSDLNETESAAIESYSREKGFAVLGRLPHDPIITRAMIHGKTITEYAAQGDFSIRLKQIWRQLTDLAAITNKTYEKQAVNKQHKIHYSVKKENTMNTLIAIPSSSPGGLGAPLGAHFGHCDLYTLVSVQEKTIQSVSVIPNVPHQQGGCMAPVQYLADKGAKKLIAGGMGFRPLMGFNQAGIDVYFGGNFQTVGDAVNALINGELPQFSQEHTCGGGH